MITLWNFNIWMTCTMVPYTLMRKLKKNAGMHNEKKSSYHLPCHYFGIMEILEMAKEQLPRHRERTVVYYIT